MKVKTVVILFMLLFVSLTAYTANAGPHYIGGTVTFSISSLVATGDFAGYGQQNILATLTGTGTVKAMCQSPGGNQAPGRNSISVSASQTSLFTTDENGKVTIRVETPDPSVGPFAPSPSPKEAGCPSGKWTVIIVPRSTNWTGALLTITAQSSGEVLFQQSYTCVTTFNSDGTNSGVTCTPQ